MQHNNRHDAPFLLDIPDRLVMPILEKIGTRLEPGQNWAHGVWVETDGQQTIAYADMAGRIEDPYQVTETDVVFYVPRRAHPICVNAAAVASDRRRRNVCPRGETRKVGTHAPAVCLESYPKVEKTDQ